MLHSADLHLIQRETALTGLKLLLDDIALLEYLRHTWPQIQWRSLRIRYLRYKPHTNCLVALEAQVSEQTGEVQSLWLYAKAFTNNDENKLRKWQQRPGYSEILGVGRWVCPDNHIKISLLPNDAKLKFLPKLLEPHRQTRTITQLLSTTPKSSVGELKLLRYKPERRLVAQWCDRVTPKALIKAYTSQDYRAARQQAQEFTSQSELAIAPLIGHHDKYHFLAWQWLSGIPLTDWMLDSRFGIDDLKRVGAALARVHQQTPSQLPSFSLRQHIQSLKELADWLRFLLPTDGLKILAIAQSLSEKLNQLPVITTAIHGDFYADQILWQSNHIAIIDWDRATWGHPAQDIGNFIAHLERQALWDDQSLLQVRALEQALLTGYESRGGAISSEALRTYLAVGLFALLPEPFRYRHPHWPRQIQLILSRVNQLLQPVTAESLEPWVGAEC